ncbi:MAG: FKBP-type peptidyl-prolyl cis-trans isomerase [Bacteroides sp.]
MRTVLRYTQRVLGVVAGVLLLSAQQGCKRAPEGYLEGYTQLIDDTYYRLATIGEGTRRASLGDYVTLQLRYATLGDSTFFTGLRRFQIEPSPYEGSIDACFTLLAEGDSANFYLNPRRFFEETLQTTLPHFLDSAPAMRIDVKVLALQDSFSYARDKEAFVHWIEDFSAYERVLLAQYIAKERMNPHAVDSLFYLQKRAGSGDYPRNGDTLTIEFEGRFLDGEFFDSTKKRKESFQFVLGQKWQVIDGIERAVRMMREGEHSLFILPSGVAFGAEGSSTGIVPPYTPVIFEIELTELKPGERAE